MIKPYCFQFFKKEGATAYRGSDPDEKGPWFKIFKNVDLSNKEQLKGKFEVIKETEFKDVN